MNRFLLIILSLLLGTISQAQIRETKPEIEELTPMNADFFPDPGIPLPDSSQKQETIQFFENKIENLSGKTSVYNQALILYCLAELNRINGKSEEAVFVLLEAYKSVKNELNLSDKGRLQSRLCFNALDLLKRSAGRYPITEATREMGFGNFEEMMEETIIVLREVEDENNVLAMLNTAFEYYQLYDKPKEAFIYGNELIKYKDYVASQFLQGKLSELKDNHEMTRKESEIRLLNNQKIIYQEKIKTSTRQQWTIIGGIGVLLIFVFALWHRVRVIHNIRDLLQAKAAQLQHEKNRAEKSEWNKDNFLPI